MPNESYAEVERFHVTRSDDMPNRSVIKAAISSFERA